VPAGTSIGVAAWVGAAVTFDVVIGVACAVGDPPPHAAVRTRVAITMIPVGRNTCRYLLYDFW